MTRIRYTPRPYQHPATEHIMNTPRCALWADMGMGKGVATLTALDAVSLMGDEVFPALSLGPLRVARDVWPGETGKWEHLAEYDVSPIIGAEKHRLAAIHRDRPIYTMNYEHLPWLVKHWGENWPYRTVIADESTKLKNYRGSIQTGKTGTQFVRGGGGQRARALAKVAHTKVKRFIELTGTPAPNGLKNLWAQMWFLDAGLRLGRTYTAFTQRWFRIGYNGYDLEPLPHANAEIHALIADLCLTLDPKDWFPNLKEPIVNTVYVELPPKAWKHYREMEKQMFTRIAGKDITAAIAAARTQKCLQMCLAAGTEVLTRSGWKPIETFDSKQQLWDGYQWVNARKLVSQGVQKVINCWGVYLTPDHRVLTNRGWRTAEGIVHGLQHHRYDRSDFRLPDNYQEARQYAWRQPTGAMAVSLRVRGAGNTHRNELAAKHARGEEVVRVPQRGNADRGVGHPRHDRAPGMARLDGHEATVRQLQRQKLAQLWRAWGLRVQTMARVFRELLGRHGIDVVCRRLYRPYQQQRRLHALELPMGYDSPADEQYESQRGHQYAAGAYDSRASRNSVRYQTRYALPKTKTRLGPGNRGYEAGEREAPTFDILDAGPRNQFVVRPAGGGQAFIVHNCNGAVYITPEDGSRATEYEIVHSAKLEALESIVEEANGEPMLVAYEFHPDKDRLMKLLPGAVDISTQKGMAAFKAGGVAVGLAHAASVGHGVDGLQNVTNTITFFGHNWDLELYDQIIGRIGPMRQLQSGYDRPVHINHIVARGTLDEDVIERRVSKRDVQDILKDAMKRRGL